MLSKDSGDSKPQLCRNIQYEPLDFKKLEIFAYGPRTKDGVLQRAAKRRKVEALAGQYLQGKPIYIRSVLGPFDGRWINPWDRQRSNKAKGRTSHSPAASLNKDVHLGASHAKGTGKELSEIAFEESQAMRRAHRSPNKEPAGVSRLERSFPQLNRRGTVTAVQETALQEGSNEGPAGGRATKTHWEVDTWLRKISEAGIDGLAEDEGQGDGEFVDHETPSRLPQLCQDDRDLKPSQSRKSRSEVRKVRQDSSGLSRRRHENESTLINKHGLIRLSKQNDHGRDSIQGEDTERDGATSLRGEDGSQGVREAARRSKHEAKHLRRDSECLSTFKPARISEQRLGEGSLGRQRDVDSLAVEASPNTAPRTVVGQGQSLSQLSRKQVTPARATGAEPVFAAEAVMQSRPEEVPQAQQGPSQALPPFANLSEFKFRRTKVLSKPLVKKALTGPQSVTDNTSKSGTKNPRPMSFPPSPTLRINQLNAPNLPLVTEASDLHTDALMPIRTAADDSKIAREDRDMADEVIPNVPAASATANHPRRNSGELQTGLQGISNHVTASPERLRLQKETTDSLVHNKIANDQGAEIIHSPSRGASEHSRNLATDDAPGTVVAGPVIGDTTAPPLERRRLMSPLKDSPVRRPLTPKTNNVMSTSIRGVYAKQASPMSHPFPPQESNFCTQAAMFEAEQAFQAGLESAVKELPLPLHNLAEHLQSVDASPHRSSEPIKHFRAFDPALDEASDIPPLSTQQLFEEADLNFASTVKKSGGGKRASFAPSPTADKRVQRNSDKTAEDSSFENNYNNNNDTLNVPTVVAAEHVPDVFDMSHSVASASVSKLTESTNLTSLTDDFMLLGGDASDPTIGPPSTTPKSAATSLDERTQMPREEVQLNLRDDELDATVNGLDKFLDTVDVETEAKNLSAPETAKTSKNVDLDELTKSAKSNDDSSLNCTSIKKTSFYARRGALAYKPSRRK